MTTDRRAILVSLISAGVVSIGLFFGVYGYTHNSDRISTVVQQQGQLIQGQGKVLQRIGKIQHRTSKVQRRLVNDERHSCKIQQRGLKTSHIQTRINREISELTSRIPPLKPGASKFRRYLRSVAIQLHRNTAKYYRIERYQPKGRDCRSAR